MDTLIVINEQGLPLFEYSFRSNQNQGDTILIAGAITAISSIIKEAFNTIKTIEYQILFYFWIMKQ